MIYKRVKDHRDVSFIIPLDLFRITRPFISIGIPYCELNETKSKHFLKRFVNEAFRAVIEDYKYIYINIYIIKICKIFSFKR